jgi:uncharacterized protein (TIGR03663 family)
MNRHRLYFALAMLAAFAVAAALRLPRLDLRPMHADEANQAVKSAQLYETGKYEYDATDHHGPSLYWLTLPSLAIRGVKDLAGSREVDYRIVPALFGVGLIGLLLLFVDGLCRTAVAVAAVLTAISPAMVFYSRYYIQETLLLLFTLAALGCGWRYLRTRRLAWMLLAGGAAGMMHATKETWILSAASAAAAVGLTWGWSRICSRPAPRAARLAAPGGRHAERAGYFAIAWHLLAGVLVACLVAAAFFSVFGKNWRGPWASIQAYANYFRRGSEHGEHSEPWYYYLQIVFAYRPAKGFFWSEGFIAVLAIFGAASSLSGIAKPKAGSSTLRIFLTFYTLLLIVLYSAISYKTPWCALSLLSGMILLAGIGAEAIFSAIQRHAGAQGSAIPRLRFGLLWLLAIGALTTGAAHLGWQAYRLSFDPRLVCDPRNPYVYSHTPPGLPRLAERLDRLRQRMPPGRELTVHVVVKENYWPLPWYLRKFKPRTVGYWLDPAQWQKDLAHVPMPDALILSEDVDSPELAARLHDYNGQMIESLRPGSLVRVYVGNRLWPEFIAARDSQYDSRTVIQRGPRGRDLHGPALGKVPR